MTGGIIGTLGCWRVDFDVCTCCLISSNSVDNFSKTSMLILSPLVDGTDVLSKVLPLEVTNGSRRLTFLSLLKLSDGGTSSGGDTDGEGDVVGVFCCVRFLFFTFGTTGVIAGVLSRCNAFAISSNAFYAVSSCKPGRVGVLSNNR